MKLQNLVMQLRKISSHPFLFDWPTDPKTGELVVNQDLVNASGKMLLLNRLLDALLGRGHKVLIFSQFTSCLDIIVSTICIDIPFHLSELIRSGGMGKRVQRNQNLPD
jgi:SNF2 family DNA or RNA helicase